MNILLIYGGKSCEHDISIITACLAKGYFSGNLFSAYLDENNICNLVSNDLTPNRHKVTKFTQQLVFLPGRKQVGVIRRNKLKSILDIDAVVNCCHGMSGEDGTIAGLCKLCNIPIVGCDVIPAAVTMDKTVTKQMLNLFGFPTVNGVSVRENSVDLQKIEELQYPIIVKPSRLGSSIGISVCHNREELISALNNAFAYDDGVLCEKALTDYFELNCSAIRLPNGNVEASRVERPYTTHDILTFGDKYECGEKVSTNIAKEPVCEELSEKVRQMTIKIYENLGLSGVVRVDYIICKVEIFVNEVNSIPGSLAYGLWQDRFSPKQFGDVLLHRAILDFHEDEKKTHSFLSEVLNRAVVGKILKD